MLACYVDALPLGAGYRVDGLAVYCDSCGIVSGIVPGSETMSMDEPDGAWLADEEERLRGRHRAEVTELHASLGIPVPD